MATTVNEIMNRELFCVRPNEPASYALDYLRRFGIHAAPVIDSEHEPLGMLAVSDLLGNLRGVKARDRMTVPVATIQATSKIADAARRLAERGYHHLIVLDRDGTAVGFLSAIDLIRGLLGMPAKHPPAFPHYDEELSVNWTDDSELTPARLESAPEHPGLFVLVAGGPNRPERPVWAEASTNIRARLREIVHSPARRPGRLEPWFESAALRWRAAPVGDDMARSEAFGKLLARMSDGS